MCTAVAGSLRLAMEVPDNQHRGLMSSCSLEATGGLGAQRSANSCMHLWLLRRFLALTFLAVSPRVHWVQKGAKLMSQPSAFPKASDLWGFLGSHYFVSL